jgi:hypothetical protein
MPGMSERQKNGSVGEVARNSTSSASVVEMGKSVPTYPRAPDKRKFKRYSSGHPEKAQGYDRSDGMILRTFGGTSRPERDL